jgi:hypothetical protein
MGIEQGDFVEVRGRQWMVEAINDAQPDLTTVKLSCIADGAQGEQIEVLWDAELHAAMDRAVLEAYGWHDLALRLVEHSCQPGNDLCLGCRSLAL